MHVPLLDLKIQYNTIKAQVLAVTREIYESQSFILGPHVEMLERQIADYCRVEYAVGVSSGTDALLVSLMAAGVKQGDLVLTTPFTFFATAGAIARVGATPLFCDIDPDTYNLDPKCLMETVDRLSPAEKGRVKAVIPVHLYGQCADMDAILSIAEREGWVVIEDAAQAIGSEDKNRRAGSMGTYGCFSFFPSKNLGGFGDGGAVTTRLPQIRDQLKTLRVHGSRPKYIHRQIGGNFRLDALQAAVVSIKLAYLDRWTAARQGNARRYRHLFSEAGLAEFVQPPVEKTTRHIYNQFVVRIRKGRDRLRAFLADRGVATEIYYPVPLHLQECFSDLGYGSGDFPAAESAAEQTLALPIYPELSASQQVYVVESVRAFFKPRHRGSRSP